MLRLTKSGKRKYVSLGISVKEKDWTKSGKRKYVSLGISVKEKDWDFKKNQPKKSCPDREAIVKLISDKVS